MMSDDRRLDLESYLSRFRLSAFRPGQEEVISTVLAGQDCLCVMPTGGGKSLCYQLPALVLDGLTLVVSPLIALMKDQVDQLLALELPVTFINSTLSMAEQYERLEKMAAGQYRLVYVVPERFRSSRFLEAVRQVKLKLLAVDEAHCISEWGHDFRPDYARLGNFRRLLGRPTTIALTATATDAVRRDIVEQLKLEQPRTFITGFARPNLFYEVRSVGSEREKSEMLARFLRQTPGSGIIYASTRKRTEEVAATVAAQLGRSTVAYHAGLLPNERRAAHEAFMGGRVEIVAATTAFGMGIDKADVRFVVHYNLPGSLEAYYQEAGRAGRDGDPSRCLLLYNASDRYIQEYFIESAYPARENVARVYDFLRTLDDDPIELTQQEIKERLGLPIGGEGVGTCEQLLESAGVLERLIASQNRAAVRLDSDLPTLVDLLPKQARVRRKVLRAVEQLVGPRRHEMVPFHPRELLKGIEVDQSSLVHALRELNNLDVFTYVPPFRGRAIRMVRRDLPFDGLEIDFEAVERLKKAEYQKLNRVIRFALSARCRQQEILRYFGERNPGVCHHCDNCEQSLPSPERTDPAAATEEPIRQVVRMVLSGVARTQTQLQISCGKNLIAQMLCGSTSARMSKLGMNRLSTFGLLGHLTQPEVVFLIDGLIATGHLEQVDIEPRRPVVRLTPAGSAVMKGSGELGVELPIPAELRLKLRGGDRAERTEDSPKASRATEPASESAAESASESAALGPPDLDLLAALKEWRRQTAAGAGVPLFRVLSNATLDELARRRPETPEALLQIKGIGETKLRVYGETLLGLLTPQGTEVAEGESAESAPAKEPRRDKLSSPVVGRIGNPPGKHDGLPIRPTESSLPPEAPVAKERALPRGITADPLTDASAPRSTGTQPNHYWTWRLLSTGFSAEECATIRGVDRAVILDHALRAVEEGWPVEARWCLSSELLAALEEAIGAEEPVQIRPLLPQLPAGTRYEEVQLFLKCRKQALDD